MLHTRTHAHNNCQTPHLLTVLCAENPFLMPWQTGMGVVVVKSRRWLLYNRRVYAVGCTQWLQHKRNLVDIQGSRPSTVVPLVY